MRPRTNVAGRRTLRIWEKTQLGLAAPVLLLFLPSSVPCSRSLDPEGEAISVSDMLTQDAGVPASGGGSMEAVSPPTHP